jgi:hypothetical protein
MNLAKSAALFYLAYSIVTDAAIWGYAIYYFFGGPTP